MEEDEVDDELVNIANVEYLGYNLQHIIYEVTETMLENNYKDTDISVSLWDNLYKLKDLTELPKQYISVLEELQSKINLIDYEFVTRLFELVNLIFNTSFKTTMGKINNMDVTEAMNLLKLYLTLHPFQNIPSNIKQDWRLSKDEIKSLLNDSRYNYSILQNLKKIIKQ